jgi:hypothetical protein
MRQQRWRRLHRLGGSDDGHVGESVGTAAADWSTRGESDRLDRQIRLRAHLHARSRRVRTGGRRDLNFYGAAGAARSEVGTDKGCCRRPRHRSRRAAQTGLDETRPVAGRPRSRLSLLFEHGQDGACDRFQAGALGALHRPSTFSPVLPSIRPGVPRSDRREPRVASARSWQRARSASMRWSILSRRITDRLRQIDV